MPHKVFLSHNSADKPEVEALAVRLSCEDGIEPWLDKWNLIPGQPWQEEIEDAMRECDCCAIFIGKGDPLGPWQNAEMRALISRQVTACGSRFAVIPVLLPGAERGQRGKLPTFLVANTWVEFHQSLDDPAAFSRLLAGIRRQNPDPPGGIVAHALTANSPNAPHASAAPASQPPPRIPTGEKQKILFLAANPTNETRLALDVECREIEARIRAAEHRDLVEMHTKFAVRPADLLQYLQQHTPHIVHFSGHGSTAEEIILLGPDGKAKPVTASAITQLFRTLQDNIRVVVFNACFSRAQAEAVTGVIDCAVGMKQAIGDEAAITFAAAFYQSIAFGRSVRTAFEAGKTAIMLEGIPEEDTPELLTRTGVDANQIILARPSPQ